MLKCCVHGVRDCHMRSARLPGSCMHATISHYRIQTQHTPCLAPQRRLALSVAGHMEQRARDFNEAVHCSKMTLQDCCGSCSNPKTIGLHFPAGPVMSQMRLGEHCCSNRTPSKCQQSANSARQGEHCGELQATNNRCRDVKILASLLPT